MESSLQFEDLEEEIDSLENVSILVLMESSLQYYKEEGNGING